MEGRGYQALPRDGVGAAPVAPVRQAHRWPAWLRALTIGAIAVAVACLLIVPLTVLFGGIGDMSSNIHAERIRVHLVRLESTAVDGSRAPWTGYNNSLAYIESQLRTNTNFAISKFALQLDTFEAEGVPTLVLRTPYALPFVAGRDFAQQPSAPGALTGSPLVLVARQGCEDADWPAMPARAIALVWRGNCTFAAKIAAAQRAGCAGLLIANNVADAPPFMLAGSGAGSVTVFSTSYETGSALALYGAGGGGGVTLDMSARGVRGRVVTTQSLCADSPFGSATSVIVTGAHLDSVEAGKGMNDDGSGSIAVLELALQSSRVLGGSKNRLRFCWWAAEEEGLLGSIAYFNQLSPADRTAIVAYINQDMLGSLNAINNIFDGSTAPDAVRNASVGLTRLYEAAFSAHSLPYELQSFSTNIDGASSDWGAFLFGGVPSGGTDTGAGEIKSDAQRKKFGGLANTPADACYHQPCDTLLNVDVTMLTNHAKCTGTVLGQLSAQSNVAAYLRAQSVAPSPAAAAKQARARPVRHEL